MMQPDSLQLGPTASSNIAGAAIVRRNTASRRLNIQADPRVWQRSACTIDLNLKLCSLRSRVSDLFCVATRGHE
jgi:hypothetical protein